MSDQSTPEMREFITGILRSMEGNALISFADPNKRTDKGKPVVNRHHWFAYPAELDKMVEIAERAVIEKRDGYLSPIIYGDQPYFDQKRQQVVTVDRNGRPMYSRQLGNALFSQTVYMDSDTAPPSVFRAKPSRHVDTSKDHGHDYWFLNQPVPAALAAEIAHRITTAHQAQGTDANGWSANKLLRLPTWHTGDGTTEPTRVEFEDDLVDASTGEAGELIYDIETLREIYSDIEVDAVALEKAVGHAPGKIPPVPPIEGLPVFEELLKRIPNTDRRLNDLIYKIPATGEKGWRSEQLYALLLDCKRFGFTDEETISIAWHAPASSKYKTDARGIDGLWWELQVRVNSVISEERGTSVSAAEPLTEKPSVEAPRLLGTAEKRRVDSRNDLITLYLAYARDKVRAYNAPLHHAKAWMLMSVALGDTFVIPKEPKDLPGNLWMTNISPSSSGKGEALGVFKPILEAMYSEGSPDVGARHSKEALIEQLIDRDGRVTFINTDEAHGWIQDLKDGRSGSAGVRQVLTEGYDGGVPTVGRVGRQDLSKAGRKTVLAMDLTGPPDGMYSAFDKEMFYEGFLARMIWIVGEVNEATEENTRTHIRRKSAMAPNAMPRYWASYLTHLRQRILNRAPLGSQRLELFPTDEAQARLDKAKWDLTLHFKKYPNAELWNTIVRRMGDIMWKIAAISAVINERDVIATRDVEVAISCAEIWIGNAIIVSTKVADTPFAKACNEIETFIAAHEQMKTDIGSIRRFRRGERNAITDEYLASLASQGRIEEYTTKDNQRRMYRIRPERQAPMLDDDEIKPDDATATTTENDDDGFSEEPASSDITEKPGRDE